MIGLDGRPQVKNLNRSVSEWLRFRLDTVTKRLQASSGQGRKSPASDRGLRIAYLNLDEVIRIVRSRTNPSPS